MLKEACGRSHPRASRCAPLVEPRPKCFGIAPDSEGFKVLLQVLWRTGLLAAFLVLAYSLWLWRPSAEERSLFTDETSGEAYGPLAPTPEKAPAAMSSSKTFEAADILNPDSLRLDFYLPQLERATVLRYPDPRTGAPRVSTNLRREAGLSSTSHLGAVTIAGLRRPATLTLDDQGGVFITLPYAGGVLSGEAIAGPDGRGTLTLQRSRPFRDSLKQPATAPPMTPKLQAPTPRCVNCS